jgi:eukaryotic-like serine/threonine-protein kinase
MIWLSDDALDRLRAAITAPDVPVRYRLLAPIGRGGMGTVYLAEDIPLARRVALKVLDVAESSEDLAERMLREARVLALLEHPGIVPVHDVGRLADGRVFYTMKFVQGSRLDQYIAEVSSLHDRLRIFEKICDAVAFAHVRGVLHRDLKPENIMVGAFGEVLVMDWGVAKILRVPSPLPTSVERRPSSGHTAHGEVLGTPGYMAPEQARGEVDSLDERTDVYALGAILRFVIAGLDPRDSAAAQVSSIPKRLGAVRTRAMAAAPNERYRSVRELAADVARYLDGLPVMAYRESLVDRAARWAVKHRVWIGLLLAYASMRILLLFWLRR